MFPNLPSPDGLSTGASDFHTCSSTRGCENLGRILSNVGERGRTFWAAAHLGSLEMESVLVIALTLLVISIRGGVLSCTIPPYAALSTSSSNPLIHPQDLDVLILEGRCFLGCLDNDSFAYVGCR